MQERDLNHCELSVSLEVDGQTMRYELTRTEDGHVAKLSRDGATMIITGKDEKDIRRFLTYLPLFFHKLDGSF